MITLELKSTKKLISSKIYFKSFSRIGIPKKVRLKVITLTFNHVKCSLFINIIVIWLILATIKMWCVKSSKRRIYLREFAIMLLKFTRLLCLFIKFFSFFNQTIQMASLNTSIKRAGWPKNEVWEHYQQNVSDSEGHTLATCIYCDLKYSRGEVTVLQD